VSGAVGARPPEGSRAAKDVSKYLLPDEEPRIATRRHWAVLLEPAARAVPGLVAGGWLLTLDPRNKVTSTAGLLLLVAAAGYLALRTAEWRMRQFIVSRRRMLLTSGIFVRTVTFLPMHRITDLTWQETLFGQLLGYGTFRIESAGQHQALAEVTFLPNAAELYRGISRLLFLDGQGGGAPFDAPAARSLVRRDIEVIRRDTEPIPPLPPPP
jgi:membrane protein YdbS with pleckstrin-like domain